MTDDLVAKLRDEDSYYRLQEKHWCIDAEELERQRLAAADRIEALEAEVQRLNAILSEMNDTDIIAKTMAENERLRLELSDTATKCSWAVDTFNTGFSGYEAVLLHQRRIADEGPPSNWKDGMKAYAARAALGTTN